MKKRTLGFILFLVVSAVGVGLLRYYYIPTYYPHLIKQTAEVVVTPVPEASPEPELTATGSQSIATISAQLLKELTPRQKVAQLVAVPVTVSNDQNVASSAAVIQNEIPGFVTIFGQRISALQADRLTTTIKQIPLRPEMIAVLPNLSEQQRLLLRPMIAIDHEGGSVQRLSGEGITTLPSAAEQCQLDRNSLKGLLDRVAKELHGVGIDIVFAPVVDLGVNHPVLRSRLCSDNIEVVRTYGEFWIDSMSAQNVIPVLKHFPGIGQTTVDLHQKAEAIPLNPPEHRLFLGLLNSFPNTGVMTSHVVLEQAGQMPTEPCTVSADCLALLQLTGQHLIFSDGLEMAGAQGLATGTGSAKVPNATLSDLAVQSIEAGHNVVVLGKSVPTAVVDQLVTDLADRYQRNPVFKQQVDKALQTTWQIKFDHWSAQD